MYLSSVKIAGFKSFYRPVTLNFPSNRVVLIGPNGCGKSNIIDAIRWVLGESSASGLRSDSLEELIFSGTEDYPPTGRTSIELAFDDCQGCLSGKLAQQDHIKVRRTLERDKSSRYYINNSLCRRKDIEELFAGMGLTGKAHYAVITQGTIHSLVESKPEHIRLLIEEAANITDYRHKRKETLIHIKNTKANLRQVSLALHDIKMRMRVLEKQAQDAKQFQDTQQEIKKLKKDLAIVLYQNLEKEKEAAYQQLNNMVEKLENYKNDAANAMTEKEKIDLKIRNSATQLQNLVASQQQLKHQEITLKIVQEYNQHNLIEKQRQFNEIEGKLRQYQENITKEQEELALLKERLTASNLEEDIQNKEDLVNLTNEYNKLNTEWQHILTQVAEKESTHQQLHTQLSNLQQEVNQAQEQMDADIKNNIRSSSQNELDKTERRYAALEKKITFIRNNLIKRQKDQKDIEQKLIEGEHKKHKIEQELTRIKTLLNELSDPGLSQKWLHLFNRANISQLWSEKIVPPSGWSKAVDMVAQQLAQARISYNLDKTLPELNTEQDIELTLIAPGTTERERFNEMISLGEMLKERQIPAFFHHIYPCKTLTKALKLRAALKSYQSLITPTGEWLGKNWIIIKRGSHSTKGIFIQQQRRERLLNEKTIWEKEKEKQFNHISLLQEKNTDLNKKIAKDTDLLKRQDQLLFELKEEITKMQVSQALLHENREKKLHNKHKKAQLDKEILKVNRLLKSMVKEKQLYERKKEIWKDKRSALDKKNSNVARRPFSQSDSQSAIAA